MLDLNRWLSALSSPGFISRWALGIAIVLTRAQLVVFVTTTATRTGRLTIRVVPQRATSSHHLLRQVSFNSVEYLRLQRTYPATNTSNQTETVSSSEILIPTESTWAVWPWYIEVREMLESTTRTHHATIMTTRRIETLSCRRARPAALPELLDLFAELLAGR